MIGAKCPFMHASYPDGPKDSKETLRNGIVRYVCATQCIFIFVACHLCCAVLCCAWVLCQKPVEMKAHPRLSQTVSPASAVS